MEENPNPSNPSSGADSAAGKAGSDVLDELRELGRNLSSLLQSAWESDERKKLQSELESGLNDVYNSLRQAAKEFSEGPTGQTLKTDLEDLGQRIRSGEVEVKVRSEVLNALRAANEELKKASTKTPPPPESGTPGSGTPESGA